MDVDQIQERIEKAQAVVVRKQNTIAKKQKQIEKKQAQVDAIVGDSEQNDRDRYWLGCDIRHLNEDIARGQREIQDKLAVIEKYRVQIEKEQAKNERYAYEVPEVFKEYRARLFEIWNQYDLADRAKSIAECGYYYKSEDEIRRDNARASRAIIMDLYNRVRDITGNIVDYRDVRVEEGNGGHAVLNGIIVGERGRANVESIYAGGYNIQRLHVRTLVHRL